MTTETVTALGLSLYLVKLIAESHGGWVKAEDLKDQDGTVFTVSLPLLRSLDATDDFER